jgi:hypothetical protein
MSELVGESERKESGFSEEIRLYPLEERRRNVDS